MRKTITILFFILLSGISVALAQNITVKGTVSDKTGAPLPGVTVTIKGTQNGTVTDVNGAYKLSVAANGTLDFSFVGYSSKSVAVANSPFINVTLEDNTTGLNEVVVIGYGTQKKATVTGATSTVTSADLKDQQITRIDDALQGRAAGVLVVASSGAPGAGPSVVIRGVNSFGNTSPLYVIDGVIWDNGGYDLVNPNDVESVTVLKDASAAIYGSRASDGVILITTKQGKQGTPKITYDFYYGTQNPIKKLALTDASQYATLRDESTQNAWLDTHTSLAGYTAPFANPASYGTGTNWQDELFSSAPIQSHNLSISGATETSNYFTSLGYLDQEGIVDPSASDYKRMNIRVNATFKPKKWLTFGENFTYAYTRSTTFFNTNSVFGGPLSDAINLDPLTPVTVSDINAQPNAATYNSQAALLVRNAQGLPYGISNYVSQEIVNPLAQEAILGGNYNWSHNLVGDTYLQIEPIKGLTIKSEIAGKQAFYGTESFSPLYYLNASTFNNSSPSQGRSSDQNLEWNWDNTATYTRSIGKHNFTALIGQSAEQESGRSVGVTYLDEPISTYQQASFNFSLPAADILGYGGDQQPLTRASLFARVTYDYDGKYLLQGIIRRDGSSKFGSNNIYGTFPSVSAGWVISKEDFFPKNSFVDNLKLRASYGVLGNELVLGEFYYSPIVAGINTYPLGNPNQNVTGYGPNTLANPNLQWEKNKSTDIGLDAILFHDLTATIDVYNKVTNGLIMNLPLPAYAGVPNPPYSNAGGIRNRGIELQLGYTKKVGEVNLGFNGNISYNNNLVTSTNILQYINEGSFQSSNYSLQRIQVGEPFDEFYGYKTDGVFQSQAEINSYKDAQGNLIQPNAKPGDLKYVDVSGTGPIGAKDRTFLGNPNPPFTYGFTINASYHAFDASLSGQGVWGNKVFEGYRRLDIATANYPIAALNAWTPTNPSNYPRLTDDDTNGNFTNPSDFYLQSGAYFRIQNAQLGYTLPKWITTKLDMYKFRVYLAGDNLATITKYNGYDPEVAGGVEYGVYPVARTLRVGVDVTL